MKIVLSEILWPFIVLACLLLPFSKHVRDNMLPGSFFFDHVDEGFICLLIPVSLLAYARAARVWRQLFPLALIFSAFLLLGLVSGWLNGLPILPTVLGTLDYLKNFLPVLLLPALCFRPERVRRLYAMLSFLALVLVGIGVTQEILWTRGIFPSFLGQAIERRFGLWRTPSLFGHPNFLGLYSVLFFTLELAIHRKLSGKAVLLLPGIVLSGSKFVWASTLVVILVFLLDRRERTRYSWTRKAALTVGCLLLAVAVFPYIWRNARLDFTTGYFRGYTWHKSLDIWEDNPVIGTSPGSYGGVVSLVFGSPIYQRYNFSPHWLSYMKGTYSLDQFWPQCLAEAGALGLLLFMLLLFFLFQAPRDLSRRVPDPFLQGLLNGLSMVTIVLFAYLFGSGLNLAFFLLTYSILLGLALSAAGPLNYGPVNGIPGPE